MRDAPGATELEAAWAAARAAQPGWLTGAEAEAAACDATVIPLVTGHVDWAALDRFTAAYLATRSGQGGSGGQGGCGVPAAAAGAARRPLSPQTLERLRATMLRLAADVLSGPGGLASWLRQSQLGERPGGGTSLPLGIPLPLDTGEAERRPVADNGLGGAPPATRRQNFLTPPRRHRAFPLIQLA